MKMNLSRRLLPVLCVLFLASMACSLPTLSTGGEKPNTAQTKAVQTIDAMMTQVAGSNVTATPGSGGAPTATQSQATLLPSSTPLPTATQVVIPTATVRPTEVCDQAGFVSDITVADGTVLTAGSTFVKTWRLRNNGTCTWTPEYAIVFDSGEAMSAPTAQNIGVSVAPGQTVDVSVTLKAPGSPGTYRGNWRMRNAAGVLFGVGSPTGKFYVDIKVVAAPVSGSGLDFTALYCQAEWTGNGKLLPCIGSDGSGDGFVLYLAKPALETGYIDDEPGLLTNPPRATDAVIRGKFPAYTVKDKDHFTTLLTCENNAKNCNVRMQLDYQIDNGTIQTLGYWNEAMDNNYTHVDVDLSSLAGKNVNFILTVLANGASDNDRAVWVAPKIENKP
jgi:hypothetical protein